MDSADRVKTTQYIYNDYTRRPLLVATSNSTSDKEISVGRTGNAYYYYGKLYSGGSQVLTTSDINVNDFLTSFSAEKTRHDQYLYGLESNEYRVVLRIFFVTPNGNILKKRQNDYDYYLDEEKNYRVYMVAEDSSNNEMTVFHNAVKLLWHPTSYYWYFNIDDYGIYATPYWLELTAKFVSPSGADHIRVSFYGLDEDLYMYNPNQDLTFSLASLSHDTVEIKNVGLAYPGGMYGEYSCTGYTLPNETVNVPQIWASDMSNAELIRGYAYAAMGAYEQEIVWKSQESDSDEISEKIVAHDDQYFYTTGYFEIPLGSSGDFVQSNQGIANSGKVLAVNSSGIVGPVSMNAVESNQGVANAGKFLVVNSSGVVEPVSMTAWQGGSY